MNSMKTLIKNIFGQECIAKSYVFYIDSLHSKRTRKLTLSGKRFATISEAHESVRESLHAGEAISMFWPCY